MDHAKAHMRRWKAHIHRTVRLMLLDSPNEPAQRQGQTLQLTLCEDYVADEWELCHQLMQSQ